MTIGVGITSTASIAGLGTFWYKDLGKNGFKFRNDWRQWYQMDKLGHSYSGYLISDKIYQCYKWTGTNIDKSLIIGSSIGLGYLLSFEILDGLSNDWGFSWSDIGANTIGVSMFLFQQEFWNEQRIRFKFSSSLSPYAKYRPEILGSSIPERLLKDYNGQTYWLSVNASSFLKNDSKFPKWLNFSFGYSIDERLNGSQNTFTTSENLTFKSRREYLFSLDIDLQKINTRKVWLRSLLSTLNSIKIPFPTIRYANNGWRLYGIYF